MLKFAVQAHTKQPHPKPRRIDNFLCMVSSVVPVNSVPPDKAAIHRLIVAAVNSGDPALIAAAVAADADLEERAAIREFEGNMSRLDAELAALLDVLDEAG